MKKILNTTLITIYSLIILFVTITPVEAQVGNAPQLESLRGTILEIESDEQENALGETVDVELFTVELNDGEVIEFEQQYRPELQNIEFSEGDGVVIDRTTLGDGTVSYVITDFQRTNVLFFVATVFVVLVILIGRKKGIFSLASLAMSYFLIFQVMLNQIIEGMNSIVAAILVSLLVIPLNYFVAHGVNKKTAYAALSTFITIVLIGLFATWVVSIAKLTGFTSDEAGFLQQLTNGAVNTRDLLLAGIIVGTLGILDDITISQTSIANELKSAKGKIDFNELFTRTIRIGRDHIASLVNTLILVYTSTSLPLLILLKQSESDLLTTLNREVVMEELIIMLITSIALIVAVPISTYISCFFIQKYGAEKVDDGHGHHHHHH